MTGGAGFIGANLSRPARVEQGDDVVAVDDLSTGDLENLRELDVTLVEGTILDPEILDTAMQDATRGRAPRGPAVGATVDRRPVASHLANATGTLEVLEAARRGRQPPRDRGVVVVGLRRQPHAAEARGPRHHAAQPVRGEQAGHRVRTRSPTSTRSGCPRWRSASSTCSVRCRRPATPTPRSCPRSCRPRSRAVRSSCTATGTQSRDFTYVDTVTEVIADAIARGVTSPSPVNLAFGTRTDLLTLIAELEELLGIERRGRAHRDPRRAT